MEDTNQQSLDRFAPVSSSGDSAVELHNLTEQPLSPKDERIVSTNPSLDVAISGASRNAKDQPAASAASGTLTTAYPSSYTPQEQSYYYGGYDNNSSNWDEHSNYVNANNLHVIPPAMYNDNSSLFYPPGYGYDSQMAYGQFSPLPSPLSPIMFDGQLFSPHQMSMTPPYYPPAVSPGPPHVTSSQAELMPSRSSSQENYTDKAVFGPGSGYYLPFGSFGGGDLSGNSGLGLYQYPSDYGSTESLQSRSSSLDTSRYKSPLTSGTVYPQPFGIHGSYEQNVTQSPFQGFGFTSNSARHFTHGGPYQSSFGSSSNRNRFAFDKSGKRVRDRDIVSNPTDALGLSTDRNRGPRASNPKSKSFTEEGSSSGIRDAEHTAGFHANHINSPDFVTEYEQAKFFVIKSFSEDNIHKSIKYSVWASTPLGNRKLDDAYQESKEMEGICPVFLFFSVNGSGQFCGLAEMIGPVDFENSADYWQQDRWSGQFPVKWHIIKDVPNSCFRHILLENNDNKPVTHSRDSQEVKMELGIEMLKIFKNHDSETTLLDDFNFYDEREKSLLERKAKQRVSSTASPAATLATESIGQLADNLADTLRLEGANNLSKTELE